MGVPPQNSLSRWLAAFASLLALSGVCLAAPCGEKELQVLPKFPSELRDTPLSRLPADSILELAAHAVSRNADPVNAHPLYSVDVPLARMAPGQPYALVGQLRGPTGQLLDLRYEGTAWVVADFAPAAIRTIDLNMASTRFRIAKTQFERTYQNAGGGQFVHVSRTTLWLEPIGAGFPTLNSGSMRLVVERYGDTPRDEVTVGTFFEEFLSDALKRDAGNRLFRLLLQPRP